MTKGLLLSQTSSHILRQADIPAIIDLQKQVLSDLPMQNRHYFKTRGYEVFSRHIGAKMPVFGIRGEFGLSAMAMLTDPSSPAACNMQGYPIKENQKTSIIQGLLVNPDARGQGLSGRMLDIVSAFAVNSGTTTLLAKVASCNIPSMETFCRNGFEKVATDIDSTHGHKVHFLSAPAHRVQALMSAKRHLGGRAITPLSGGGNHLTMGA